MDCEVQGKVIGKNSPANFVIKETLSGSTKYPSEKKSELYKLLESGQNYQ